MINTFHRHCLVSAILIVLLPVGFFERAVAKNTFLDCSYALYAAVNQVRICKFAHHMGRGLNQAPIWGMFYSSRSAPDVAIAKLTYFQINSGYYIIGRFATNINAQFELDEGIVEDIEDVDNIDDVEDIDKEGITDIKNKFTEVMFWHVVPETQQSDGESPTVTSGHEFKDKMITKYPKLLGQGELKVLIKCATFGENSPDQEQWFNVKATCKYPTSAKKNDITILQFCVPENAGSLKIMRPTVF